MCDGLTLVYDDESGTWGEAPETYGSIAFETQEAFEEALDILKNSRWISCKEQMPEDGISVLICSDRGTISKATYDSDMGYFYIADSEFHYNELDITHWRNLPKPPKQ